MKQNQYSKDLRDLIKCKAKNETSIAIGFQFEIRYKILAYNCNSIITILKDLVNYRDFGFQSLYFAKPKHYHTASTSFLHYYFDFGFVP